MVNAEPSSDREIFTFAGSRQHEGAISPVFFTSPHSGRLYPDEFLSSSPLTLLQLRQMEDAYIDLFLTDIPQLGANAQIARTARAYVDLNRSEQELDPLLIEHIPQPCPPLSPRTAAGLGVVPRQAQPGLDIYRCKLGWIDVQRRIASWHRPYHAHLKKNLNQALNKFGYYVLFDIHSMPTGSASTDIVIGDCHGTSCHPALSAGLQAIIETAGFSVGRNAPFSGGYTAMHYGHPRHNRHVIQIEIDRDLYLDETRVTPTDGFHHLQRRLNQLWASMIDAVMRLAPVLVASNDYLLKPAAE